MTTTTTTATAREVVAEYLRTKAESNKPNMQRDRVARATFDVINELPDGFTDKDVRACVASLTDGDTELEGFTTGRRARVISKALGELVADGTLATDAAGGTYAHRTP